MSNHFKNFELSFDTFDVCLLYYFLLFQYLNSYLVILLCSLNKRLLSHLFNYVCQVLPNQKYLDRLFRLLNKWKDGNFNKFCSYQLSFYFFWAFLTKTESLNFKNLIVIIIFIDQYFPKPANIAF